MDLILPYIPYLIIAAASWALSSRSGIYLPFLDPSTVMEPPITGRPVLDMLVRLIWRMLPDDKTRELVAEEVRLIAKALDHYKVEPWIDSPKPPPS